jgi:hypothetical protein
VTKKVVGVFVFRAPLHRETKVLVAAAASVMDVSSTECRRVVGKYAAVGPLPLGL